MAQRVLLVCDMHDDERTGAETVGFALDGSRYEIDLCEEHAGELRDSLARFVAEARRSGRGGGGGTAASAGATRRNRAARAGGSDNTAEIREWARANGEQVSDRGRVPARVIAAYEAAHQ